jgi:DNA-binding transcriptional LysR family regulator
VDWNDLRYFLAVARAGSLAGAARALDCEHSTVGRRIAALEAALEVTLFRRQPDGVALTDDGVAILPLAEEAERGALAVERLRGGADTRLEGTVRLATSEGFSGFLVKRLPALRARHAGIQVEVVTGPQAHDLMRGEADLALRFLKPTQPELIAKRLVEVGWAMYASPTYLDARGTPDLDDLRGHDVVGFDQSLRGVPGAHWLAEHGAGATVVLTASSLVSAMNAVIVGMGLGVLPCLLCEGDASLRRVSPRVLGGRDLWLVANPQAAKLARVRAVMTFLTEAIEADAALLRGEPSVL